MRDAAIVNGVVAWRRTEVTELAARLARMTDDPALAGSAAQAAAALGDASGGALTTVLDRLEQGFGLSPFERDLLVLVGLAEEHEALTEIARRLHPRGEPWLCFAALANLTGLDGPGRLHLRTALEDGPLGRRLLALGQEAVPLPERAVRLVTGLWSVLRGGDHWPQDVATQRLPHLERPDLPERSILAALDAGAVVVVLRAPTGATNELAAAVGTALARHGRTVTAFPSPIPDERARVVAAHLVARAAIPIVVGAPTEPVLPGHPSAVVVCADAASAVALDDRPTIELDLGRRTLGETAAMWQRIVPDLDADALAGLLRVDQLRAAQAVGDARCASAAFGRPIDVDAVVRHVRQRTDSRLPASVRRVEPVPAELVTTADNEALLRSIIDRVRGQVRVLHDWAFRGGRGVRALFAGPPGTGKTLATEIIAAELGLGLLVVDLSALVSKWLGETEKNIGEVFDAAEHSQAVLFFDEADAIFGRRTDGGDAQARWANMETAYLLGRIDIFDGLVVLASNLRANIDQAFIRRLDVIVEFDEPGPDERARLWRAHLPAGAPIDEDVDVDQLAELYPITGGLIRNAALGAAFGVAARGGAIGQRHLIEAVRREYQKSGRSFPGVPRVPTGAARGGI